MDSASLGIWQRSKRRENTKSLTLPTRDYQLMRRNVRICARGGKFSGMKTWKTHHFNTIVARISTEQQTDLWQPKTLALIVSRASVCSTSAAVTIACMFATSCIDASTVAKSWSWKRRCSCTKDWACSEERWSLLCLYTRKTNECNALDSLTKYLKCMGKLTEIGIRHFFDRGLLTIPPNEQEDDFQHFTIRDSL